MPGAGRSSVVPMTVGIFSMCGGLKGIQRAAIAVVRIGSVPVEPVKGGAGWAKSASLMRRA